MKDGRPNHIFYRDFYKGILLYAIGIPATTFIGALIVSILTYISAEFVKSDDIWSILILLLTSIPSAIVYSIAYKKKVESQDIGNFKNRKFNKSPYMVTALVSSLVLCVAVTLICFVMFSLGIVSIVITALSVVLMVVFTVVSFTEYC